MFEIESVLTLILIAVSSILFTILVIGFLYWLPERQYRKVSFNEQQFTNEKIKATEESRKTLTQLFGGVAIILTFVYTAVKDNATLRESRVHEEETRAHEAADAYLGAAKELKLPGDVIVHAAAIYELGQIATRQKNFFVPIINTIQVYLAERAPVKGCKSSGFSKVSLDVQAGLQVLGDRRVEWEEKGRPITLKLDGLDLSGVDASGPHRTFASGEFKGSWLFIANFSDVNLAGANLEGVCASDWRAFGRSWSLAVLADESWLRWQRYQYAVNFAGADLRGTRFNGAKLSGANFNGANLKGTDFSDANLTRADFTGSQNLSEALFVTDHGEACADVAPFTGGAPMQLRRCNEPEVF